MRMECTDFAMAVVICHLGLFFNRQVQSEGSLGSNLNFLFDGVYNGHWVST